MWVFVILSVVGIIAILGFDSNQEDKQRLLKYEDLNRRQRQLFYEIGRSILGRDPYNISAEREHKLAGLAIDLEEFELKYNLRYRKGEHPSNFVRRVKREKERREYYDNHRRSSHKRSSYREPTAAKKKNTVSIWTLLGVEKGATKAEIKKAYYKKSLKYHPDKGGTNEQFTVLTEAYEKALKFAT